MKSGCRSGIVERMRFEKIPQDTSRRLYVSCSVRMGVEVYAGTGVGGVAVLEVVESEVEAGLEVDSSGVYCAPVLLLGALILLRAKLRGRKRDDEYWN